MDLSSYKSDVIDYSGSPSAMKNKLDFFLEDSAQQTPNAIIVMLNHLFSQFICSANDYQLKSNALMKIYGLGHLEKNNLRLLNKLPINDDVIILLNEIVRDDTNITNVLSAATILASLSTRFLNVFTLETVSLRLKNINNVLLVTPLINLIHNFYSIEEERSEIVQFLPIGEVTNILSNIVFENFIKFGNIFFKMLYTFCSIPHSDDDGKLIFEELSKYSFSIMNMTDSKTILNPSDLKYFCWILIKMFEFKTIPLNLFIEKQFPKLITNLMHSLNIKIKENSILLAGFAIKSGIVDDYFDSNFFFDLIFKNKYHDRIITSAFWCISLGLCEETVQLIIHSEYFQMIPQLYQESSLNAKMEIAYFLSELMVLSTDPPIEFLYTEFLNIYLDFLRIGTPEAINKIGMPLYGTIIDALDFYGSECTEHILHFLLDNEFLEIVQQMIEDEETNEIGQLFSKLLRPYIIEDDITPV
ncbi:hypothetical protein TRFO_19155 [Tritrichomonas foetus]|uniref:Uncharacterized protein n=1 Tax=Tritrichomonas foetus TaxID=1144522 RepID=A0A1J4KPR7_9EUKA|nr:hypothetical protein TRFO_19155 [Tritrichomonas foetus]|eukprot:OHT11421.1 hypothetical protein TRFO_19155 [Tritrichomonas foetus]